uniref:Uncharacterized protein n=1 Tax=Castor canadensis TaxID=51338 RepID=A0A8C0W0U7_CASCN
MGTKSPLQLCPGEVGQLSLLSVPRVNMSYLRMENPSCHVIDASPPREKVLETVLHLIQSTGN